MIQVKTWEQTGVYDPTNPQQRIREVYAYPGDGGSFTSIYWNPAAAADQAKSLSGLGTAATTWAGIPSWGQSLLVGGLAAVAGFFAMRRYGDKYIKPTLRKVGIGK